MKNSQKLTRKLILVATPEEVWHVLTRPSETKKFMFNCEVKSDWNVGGDIKWIGTYQGYESGEMGQILEIEKNKRLKYSSIDPNFGIEVRPENFLHITYDLKSMNEMTELTTTIENFNGDAKRMEHVASAWDAVVLPAIERIFKSTQSKE